MEFEKQKIKAEDSRLSLEKKKRDLEEAEIERTHREMDLKMIEEQLMVQFFHSFWFFYNIFRWLYLCVKKPVLLQKNLVNLILLNRNFSFEALMLEE